MRAGSPVMLFALALLIAGCSLPGTPGPAAVSSAGASARSVLPGTSTPAVTLLISQAAAFAVLGHSCGGIQEAAYATGFDTGSGLPTGAVYIQTRCGGSGRGGGYHVTTYAAWVGATWDFSGNVVSSAVITTLPTINPTLTVTDTYGDSLYNISNVAYLVVPVPGAPGSVAAVQSGDQFQVSWAPSGVNPVAVISSTLTATPVGSTAATLTATVTGSAATGLIGPLQPGTTYQVSVVTSTIGGTGPASAPITVTTEAASVPPSAPTGVTAKWASLNPTGTTDNIVITWNAAVPGDAPVDYYVVVITGTDNVGMYYHVLTGTTLTDSFTVNFIPGWYVSVIAHNAAGWGPWSAVGFLGGL